MTRAVATLLVAALGLGCDGPASPRDPTAPISPLRLPEVELERAPGRVEAFPTGGRPVLLHFWATWCAPCRRELPALMEAARSQDGVTVIAVSDEDWEDLRAFFDGGSPAPIARDPAGNLARTLGVGALPETYLVDPQGFARRRAAGPVDWSDPGIRAWLRGLGARTGLAGAGRRR